MGQIVFNGQKPKYCNLTAITTGSKKDYLIPDGEIWLIDSTNTSKTDGTGKYDYYIKGDGSKTASQLAEDKIKIDDTAIQSVTVGTTTTGAAGSSASVTNTGTATEPVLNFTIPQGAQGIQGIQGPQGERGPQGNTGVTVESVNSIIHSIDPTATYAAADVAGADAVQDVLSEVTELGRETPNITSLPQSTAIIASQTNKWLTTTSAKCAFLPLQGLSKINVAASGGKVNVAFLQNETIVNNQLAAYSTQYQFIIGVEDGNNADYVVPSDAAFLYIQTANTSGVDVRSRCTITTYKYIPTLATKDELAEVDAKVDKVNVHAITPVIEVGSINVYGLDDASSFYGRKFWRTARFIKLFDISDITAMVTTSGTSLRFSYYDSDFTFIEKHDVVVSSSITDTPPASAVYLRVGVDSARPASSAFDIPKPKLLLEGNFTDDWDTPMNRPSTGSLSILVPVMVSNPDTDATETANLQDAQSLLSDTGILALPTTYSPDGTSTRLIIYCHGAGVNYAIGTGTFPTSDFLPEYWLAEGYAVMDVEGNPYNDVDEHFFIPAARECYIAAYEFVTRKYNIKKDGILLGGRSMGGGMVFDLLLSRIPVIAACPLVPAINEIWCWEYMNNNRRQFVSQKMGFTGTEPTWTSNSPMSSAEWQYLQDNFDKIIKYSPFFALMPDTPSKLEIFAVGNTSSTTDNTNEVELYADKRFKCKAPVKMFAVHDDQTVRNSRNCDLVYSMMLNAAQIVEMRYFATGGHHFELTSPYLLASYTTIYGETLTNVPVVYVEMLAFWRRYEQGL